MDNTPRQFFEEFRSSILKEKIGIIAMAIILAQAVLRLTYALSSFLVMPLIARVFFGHTHSVLFESPAPFPYEQLLGALVDFALAIVVVFYINRWVRGLPRKPDIEDADAPEIENQ
jgi:large-conductance mechanosensitive channel